MLTLIPCLQLNHAHMTVLKAHHCIMQAHVSNLNNDQKRGKLEILMRNRVENRLKHKVKLNQELKSYF